MNDPDLTHRRIKSFVLRTGKITTAQKKALHELSPRYAIDLAQPFDAPGHFHTQQPLWLDIGFGNGESVVHAARTHPHCNVLGIEVHTPGIGRLLMSAQQHGLDNIRFIQGDAFEVLQSWIPNGSLAAVHVYFPDPWHKKRHHKRRLVNDDFIALVARRLQPEGRLHIATDWRPYAEAIVDLMHAHTMFINCASDPPYSQRPDWRCETKFERRGHRLEHSSYDLIYKKSDGIA